MLLNMILLIRENLQPTMETTQNQGFVFCRTD